jgi:hypothetical protein
MLRSIAACLPRQLCCLAAAAQNRPRKRHCHEKSRLPLEPSDKSQYHSLPSASARDSFLSDLTARDQRCLRACQRANRGAFPRHFVNWRNIRPLPAHPNQSSRMQHEGKRHGSTSTYSTSWHLARHVDVIRDPDSFPCSGTGPAVYGATRQVHMVCVSLVVRRAHVGVRETHVS